MNVLTLKMSSNTETFAQSSRITKYLLKLCLGMSPNNQPKQSKILENQLDKGIFFTAIPLDIITNCLIKAGKRSRSKSGWSHCTRKLSPGKITNGWILSKMLGLIHKLQSNKVTEPLRVEHNWEPMFQN